MTFLGEWNERTVTMKWTSTDAAGVKHVGTYRFLDKDHTE